MWRDDGLTPPPLLRDYAWRKPHTHPLTSKRYVVYERPLIRNCICLVFSFLFVFIHHGPSRIFIRVVLNLVTRVTESAILGFFNTNYTRTRHPVHTFFRFNLISITIFFGTLTNLIIMSNLDTTQIIIRKILRINNNFFRTTGCDLLDSFWYPVLRGVLPSKTGIDFVVKHINVLTLDKP